MKKFRRWLNESDERGGGDSAEKGHKMRHSVATSFISRPLIWVPVLLLLLIVVSPQIVFGIASLILHVYFDELYPTSVTWTSASDGTPCDVVGTHGVWMTLNCAGRISIAPLAGMQSPLDEKDSYALDQLWALHTGANQRHISPLMCELVSVTGRIEKNAKEDNKKSVPGFNFARCTIDAQPVSRLLLSIGSLSARHGSPALSAIEPDFRFQAELAAVEKQNPTLDARRTTELAVQGWVATILGFVFAAIGVFEGIYLRTKTEKAQKETEIALKNVLQRQATDLRGKFIRLNTALESPSDGTAADSDKEAIRVEIKETLIKLQDIVRKQSEVHESLSLDRAIGFISEDLDERKPLEPECIAVVLDLNTGRRLRG